MKLKNKTYMGIPETAQKITIPACQFFTSYREFSFVTGVQGRENVKQRRLSASRFADQR
jgi:hypothetical protein